MELPGGEVCYRALQSRDARFDGLMFVGVSSTGIYCRPICPARTPKSRIAAFLAPPRLRRIAGFRPCLRCRPEIAPDLPHGEGLPIRFLAPWRSSPKVLSMALRIVLKSLAARLGFRRAPVAPALPATSWRLPCLVAQTRRVLFAKQLIHDTRMTMRDVAAAAGFSSVRRFNETFRQLFHRPPRALAQKKRFPGRGKRHRPPPSLSRSLRLGYMLAFLRARAIPGVEVVEAGHYLRTVEVDAKPEALRLLTCRNNRVLRSASDFLT